MNIKHYNYVSNTAHIVKSCENQVGGCHHHPSLNTEGPMTMKVEKHCFICQKLKYGIINLSLLCSIYFGCKFTRVCNYPSKDGNLYWVLNK